MQFLPKGFALPARRDTGYTCVARRQEIAVSFHEGGDGSVSVSAGRSTTYCCEARSCLIYAFVASAGHMRPALIAGLIQGVSGIRLFMRQLPAFRTGGWHLRGDRGGDGDAAGGGKPVHL